MANSMFIPERILADVGKFYPSIPDPSPSRYEWTTSDHTVEVAAPDYRRPQFGPWIDQDPVAPPPPPDPVNDFIQKRIAKRQLTTIYSKDDAEAAKDRAKAERELKDGKDLSGAMSKLAPHEATMHDRLMPYREAE